MSAGKANSADIAFFVLWLVLVLVPIFSEIKFGSIVELKQNIERATDDLKRDVRTELGELRLELRNSVDVRTSISPHFNIPAPARDDQLPQLENTIKAAIAEALGPRPLEPPRAQPTPDQVSDDVMLLFQTRYRIEVELRRIASAYCLDTDSRRPISGLRLAQALVQQEILPSRLLGAIREVYAVCSPAVHGAPVSPAQVAFVRDVGPTLVGALQSHADQMPTSRLTHACT